MIRERTGSIVKKSVVSTSRALGPSGCYSQAIKVGGWVFRAGNAGVSRDAGELAVGGVKSRVRQVLQNIQAILEDAGARMRDVVKVTAYLSAIEGSEAYNEVYVEFFDSKEAPARTTVKVGSLPGGMLVGIDAVAYSADSWKIKESRLKHCPTLVVTGPQWRK